MGKFTIASRVPGLAIVIGAGFVPDPYFEHVQHIVPPHPYPLSVVLWVMAIMSVQTRR